MWQRPRGKRPDEHLMKGLNTEGVNDLGAKDRRGKAPGPTLYIWVFRRFIDHNSKSQKRFMQMIPLTKWWLVMVMKMMMMTFS